MMSLTESITRLAASDTPPHVERGRQRLAKAASTLFRQQSYGETSIGDVAREAGVSVGAVYLYIKTKSDLLFLIFNDVVEEYKVRLYAIEELAGTPTEKLRLAIREYYLVLDEHHAKTEVMYHEYNSIEPEVKEYIRQVESTLEDAFTKIVRGGVRAKQFTASDPRFVARNILWLGHMWALNRGGVRQNMTIEEFMDRQTNFLLKALATDKKP